MSGECEICGNHTLECICAKMIIPNISFSPEDKIFCYSDDEGNIFSEPYSYNDWLKMIDVVYGINKELK